MYNVNAEMIRGQELVVYINIQSHSVKVAICNCPGSMNPMSVAGDPHISDAVQVIDVAYTHKVSRRLSSKVNALNCKQAMIFYLLVLKVQTVLLNISVAKKLDSSKNLFFTLIFEMAVLPITFHFTSGLGESFVTHTNLKYSNYNSVIYVECHHHLYFICVGSPVNIR